MNEVKSITILIEELIEEKIIHYDVRSMQRKFNKFITAKAKNKEEDELYKKALKDDKGHYNIIADLQPIFKATLIGIANGLKYYEKLSDKRINELDFEDIKEAYTSGVPYIKSFAPNEDVVEELLFMWDAYFNYKYYLKVHEIVGTTQLIFKNVDDLEYHYKLEILDLYSTVLKTEIFPLITEATIRLKIDSAITNDFIEDEE
ncbi:hypothetical protein [Neobacillus soli]|uniref:hypothetical protein n=1 Tax=Neobacillus soli TaxID=220688 RepID=UPI0008254EA3|nr:hypothetical protein [Neobacillus soli]